MSVLQCDRKDCENIMCNRLVLDSSRYICNDCFGELLEVKKTWPQDMEPCDVWERIEQFMDSDRGSLLPEPPINLQQKVDQEFERLTNHFLHRQ